MSLADYLAKNYLTADPPSQKKSKKRKRNAVEESSVTIADDDTLGWEKPPTNPDDDDDPTTVYSTTTSFRKSKQNNWQSLAAGPSADTAAADAIIASASAEHTARQAAADDAPQVEDSDGVLKMQSGAHAGLQTAEQVTAAIERKRVEERRKMREAEREAGAEAKETIYRDASGRIINVAMKRAEARKKEEEAARKEREEAEAGKGDVQRAMKEARRREVEEARYLTVGRSVDDVEMNEMLKGEERWNDPAAGFVEAKRGGKSVTGKPLYQGAAAPNRYGIRPGHRWDGVDRSNGFEKEYFTARNRKENLKKMEYAWGMDD
ncbi:hypothetical protein P152DRAFT_471366 [Eremomyces bilateralis CBS 781.70]|uniref:Pre-mRNA-splicing factor cwc26 n=1 Tax=Eremomyces bilateralis CBS 781.70 TaxID=1392243 RepID=A0A6G1G9B6_9PEZI|nr:uncharacterized protein P152DRAFT_471366 [Eremomyces bilateralis CBS 781.70]KAF1814685.1 hypothetical protein P152DRAFT_471366 [Eremomyces bilateralis CBS 781.70]